ncbi:MAG: epoxyalkane--coenzyme M transferase, partial [Candidatus Dormibacteraceae bacterium]
MRNSSDRILTTQAGSLPRPPDLIEMNQARQDGTGTDEAAFQVRLRSSVIELVARQRDLGLDIVGDGEYGKAMGQPVDYGAWWTYSFKRLGGLELGDVGLFDLPSHRSTPGHVVLSS